MSAASIIAARVPRCTFVVLAIALVSLGAHQAPAQTRTIIYVDSSATGAADGSSWTDAFTNLQDALTVSGKRNGSSEIWAARGTYLTDVGGNVVEDDPLATFDLPPGTALFGGFAGTETIRGERDIATNSTVLSGAITTGERSQNVVSIRGLLSGNRALYVVDGVRITDGQNGIDVEGDASAVDIVQSTFHSIDAHAVDIAESEVNIVGSSFSGGEVHIRTASAKTRVYQSTFTDSDDNSIFFSGSSEAEIWASKFTGSGNSAVYVGSGSSVRIRESLFRSNVTTAQGGGIYNDGTVSIALSTFEGNQAGVGGGYYGTLRSASNIVGTTFVRNTADQGGGAHFGGSANTLLSSYFVENEAVLGGGFINNGELTATNVALLRNTATTDGGGAYTDGVFNGANLTSAYNSAGREGGGVFADHAAANQANINNSIFFFNSAPDRAEIGLDEGFSDINVAYSDVQNGLGSGITNGGGNIDADPLFVVCQSEGFGPYTIDPICPSPASPVVDAGDNTLIPNDTLDVDGDGNTSEQLPVDAGGPRYIVPPIPIADQISHLRSLIFPYPTTGQCAGTDIKIAGLLRGWVAPVEFESSQSSDTEAADVDTTREGEFTWAFEASYDLKDPGTEELRLRIEYPDGGVDDIERQVEITEVCVERGRRLDPHDGVAYPKAATAAYMSVAAAIEPVVDMGAREAAAAPVAVAPTSEREESLRIMSVWPNPAGRSARVLYAISERLHTEARILDVLGREVASFALASGPPGLRATEVDVSHLASGLYVIMLRQGARAVTRPLVVAR